MKKSMYILTLYSLSNFWGQLLEHLCLLWSLTAAERSAPTFGLTCSPLLTPLGSPLPASPDPPCEDTPSPILLLPKPRSTLSSKGTFRLSSFCSVDKKHRSSKTHSVQSVRSLSSLTRKGQTTKGQTPAAGFPTGPRAAEVQQHLSDTLWRSHGHICIPCSRSQLHF